MTIAAQRLDSGRRSTARVEVTDLQRITESAGSLGSKAMELTDHWGQAMFVLDPTTVATIFRAAGFDGGVADGVYEQTRGIGYVTHSLNGGDSRHEFTYHIVDATFLTLRGITDLDHAMSEVTDDNVEAYLLDSRELYEALQSSLPAYCTNLMFSPEVAARVMGAFGARVSPDTIHELALRYDGQNTLDLEGRRGVSTRFIRSLTSVIAVTV